MKYTIYKIRNGEWKLEWENGSTSTHSTQYGAEKEARMVETLIFDSSASPSGEK